MSKLLYVQASPRKERSKSSQVAGAFLESYQAANPNDAIDRLNVFEEELPVFDGLALQAKYTILHGKEHTDEERQAWDAVEKIIDRFKIADKYVLSLPMWNFGIPYRLKQYIDILVQPGYTFTVGENGYEGLVKNKPAVVIYARGGTYTQEAGTESYDMQKSYMELILGFMGFEDIRSIVVEQTLMAEPNDVEKIIDASKQKARVLAKEF
jgi:FMN-dependent NADH-azoreductase